MFGFLFECLDKTCWQYTSNNFLKVLLVPYNTDLTKKVLTMPADSDPLIGLGAVPFCHLITLGGWASHTKILVK